MRKKFSFLLLLIFFPLTLFAASFDCTRARSTFEVLICNDAELSELDQKVADAYLQIRSGFVRNSLEFKKIRNEQRAFLKDRAKACPIPFVPELSEQESAKIILCLKDKYISRLYEMNQPKAEAPLPQPVLEPVEPQSIKSSDGSAITRQGIILLFVIAGIIAIWARKAHLKETENKKEEERFNKAIDIIIQNSQELFIKKKQLTVPGSYGFIDQKPWMKETYFFIDNIIIPKTGFFEQMQRAKLFSKIDEVASTYYGENKIPHKLSPVDYEGLVAVRLIENGWDTRTTKGVGDQGIDVIAIRDSVKLVIQCKLYTSPVGNSAVQEIIAGRAFEDADYAAVVSNIGYTKSARQLAALANVLLLHHDELDNIDFEKLEN